MGENKISVPAGLTREEERQFRRDVRQEARQRECPDCAAEPGERCTTARGTQVEWVHTTRTDETGTWPLPSGSYDPSWDYGGGDQPGPADHPPPAGQAGGFADAYVHYSAHEDEPSGGGTGPLPGGSPAAAESGTHGQWQAAVTLMLERLAGLPAVTDRMLAGLTTVSGGPAQISGVVALHGQAGAWAAQIRAMLILVSSREVPVVEAVAAAGGPGKIPGMAYFSQVF